MPIDESVYLKEQGDLDLDNGDYVVLNRDLLHRLDDDHIMVYEEILTFNGIVIHRRKVLYARNATAQKKPKGSQKDIKKRCS